MNIFCVIKTYQDIKKNVRRREKYVRQHARSNKKVNIIDLRLGLRIHYLIRNAFTCSISN